MLQRPASSKPPTDAENVAALKGLADQLNKIAGNAHGAWRRGGEAPGRGCGEIGAGRRSRRATRRKRRSSCRSRPHSHSCAASWARSGLQKTICRTRSSASGSTPDGRARVEVSPKGNTNDTEVLRSFARAVLAVYPNAIGGPISILESGNTVVRAFMEAGFYALISIAILLWIVLRRFGDVLLTLGPVVARRRRDAGDLRPDRHAAEFCQHHRIAVAAGRRRGLQDLLHHGLALGPHESAAIESDARGDLECLDHGNGLRKPVAVAAPGTSSMGKLLALSLVCTLAAAVLFQPALMGKPRGTKNS